MTAPDAQLASRIMIVDDVAANIAVLDGMLHALGYEQVLCLTDPAKALARFDGFEPDLVIVDLHMPEINGCDLMEQMRARVGDEDFLPVMMITADASDQAKEQALVAGVTDFLTKPYGLTECGLRVRNLLQIRHLHQITAREKRALSHRLQETEADGREQLARRAEMTRRIEGVLDGRGLTIVYQPIVDLSDRHLVGVEALARFSAVPIRPPDQWFHEANQVGRGVEFELHAATLALAALDQLPNHIRLTINLSPAAIRAPLLPALITDAARCVIELTEHEPVTDYQTIHDVLDPLRANGLRIACDDIGAGYAGLSHLVRLQPDIIKLDRALIADIDTDSVKRALVTSMNNFAQSIGADLIAEGIETLAELATVTQLGVPLGQGYAIARPGPLDELIPSAPLVSP